MKKLLLISVLILSFINIQAMTQAQCQQQCTGYLGYMWDGVDNTCTCE